MRRYYLMAIMLIAGLSFSYSQVETHYLNSGEALKHINKPWKSRARLTPEGKATVPPDNLLFLTPLKS